MKLRLPNKLIAALMSAMSAAVFTTLATGTAAYGSTTYDDLTTSDYFKANEHVYNTGKGTFYLETDSCALNLTLTLNLKAFADYQEVHDYANAGYYSPFVTWTYNNNAGATYGMADVSSGYSGADYSGITGMWNGSPWTTTNKVTTTTLWDYADENGNVTLTINNDPTNTTRNVVVTAADGTTLYSADGLRSGNYVSQHITSFTVNMNYVTSVTLNSNSILNSSNFTAPKDYTEAFVKTRPESVGRIVFLGDSITHGVQDMSWRWGLFKTMVDNGIEYEIAGPLTGYNSTPLNTDYNGDASSSQYGGATFDNAHYAQASGRTHNMLTASNSGNSLGGSTGVNYGGVTSAKVGNEYNGDTYVMMMGTNDILSDGANTVEKMQTVTNRLLGEGSLANGTWSNAGVESPLVGLTNDNAAYRGEWGTMGKIIDNMKMGEGDVMYVMPVPTWGVGRTGLAVYADLVPTYNTKLEAWTKAYSDTHTGTVKYVDINRGLVDKTLNGRYLAPDAFFRTTGGDYIHPNEQGALIIAGNLAQGMGLAGRTAGLSRSAAGAQGWDALAPTINIAAGETQALLSNVFTEDGGYTIDFGAVFGNGATGGWLGKNNALSLSVGDGINTGTLNISEGYISWGDQLLFCQDNSVANNDKIRVAFHNGNVAENVASGYYVWLGDMLIGQGLGNQTGNLVNGVSVSATGAAATLSGFSYTNTAYAPTTTYTTATPYLVQQAQGNTDMVIPEPPLPSMESHDSAPLAGPTDFTHAEPAGKTGAAVYAGSTSGEGDIVVTYGAALTGSGNWFAGQGGKSVNHSGNLSLQVTEGASGSGIFGVVNTGTADGDVTVQVDGANLAAYTGGAASIIGAYKGTITGTFTAVMNSGTLSGGIMGGFENAETDDPSIGGVDLIVNGGSVGGAILGGSKANGTVDGTIGITVTGGTISGSNGTAIIGSGTAGTVNGDIDITIKGGVIKGDIIGKQASGVTYGEGVDATVTVEGNKASIGGNITADTVKLQNVEASGYSDGFDRYAGTITATKLVLDNYTAGLMKATLVTDYVTVSNGTNATVRNLTLRNCSIDADATSTLTLGGEIHSGNTISYTGNLYLEDGTTFDFTNADAYAAAEGAEGFSTGKYIYKVKADTEEEHYEGHLLAADGSALTAAHTSTFTGAGTLLENKRFFYETATGALIAYGSDATYNITTSTVNYSDIDGVGSVTMSGGQLNLDTALNAGVTITATGGTVNVGKGVQFNTSSLSGSTNPAIVNNGGTVTLDNAAHASALLTTITGESGTIKLADGVDVTINGASGLHSHFGGVLDIGSATLKLGNGTSGPGGNEPQFDSFSSIRINGGTLQLTGWACDSHQSKLIVEGESSLVAQQNGNSGSVFNIDGVQLKAALNVYSGTTKGFVVFSDLSGAGNLNVLGSKTNDVEQLLRISDMSAYTGNVNVAPTRSGSAVTLEMYTGNGDVKMGTLSVSNHSTVKLLSTNSHEFTLSGLSGSGSNVTINAADMPLAIDLNGNYTYGGTLNASKLVVTGSGTQALSGTTTLSGAEIGNGATLDLSGTTTLSGAEIANGATLALGGTTTLKGMVTNAGSLELNGNVAVNASDIGNFEFKNPGSGNYTGQGTYEGSGYLSNAEVYLVKSNGGSVSGTGSFTGVTATADGNGNYTFAVSDDATYHINSALTYNNTEMGRATSLYIAKGATLTKGDAATEPKSLSGTGTFVITSAMNNTGSGETLPTNFSMSDSWHGIVQVNGGTMQIGTTINNLTHGDSWVELKGVKGYLGGNITYAGNIILTNNGATAAMTITSSTSGGTTVLSGKIKGNGDIYRTIGNGNTITFAGDISGWTGTYNNGGNASFNTGWSTVNFRANETINANFVNTAYSANCVLTLNYNGATVVNGTLYYGDCNNRTDIKPLNVNVNGTSVTFNNSATIGTLSASGKTVTLGTHGEGEAATQGNLTLKESGTVGTLRVEGGTITLAATPKKLSVQNSLYISEGSLVNANTVQAVNSYAPTLEGAGTFLLNNRTLPTGFTLGETWTGSVLLKDTAMRDAKDTGNYWMNALSKEGSWLELSGFTGYDNSWAYNDNTANIRLTNSDTGAVAWTLDGGASNPGHAHDFSATGKWSGTGTFKASGTNNLDFRFAGDISEWTGAFEYASNSANLTFEANATDVNAAINRTSGTLNLVVGEGNGDFAFNNTVNVNKVTVTEGQTASFGTLTTGTIALENNAEMSIRKGGSLTYTKSANAITLATGSVLDVTALGADNDTRVLDLMRYASGAGTVKTKAAWAWGSETDITTKTNFDITGNLYFGSNAANKGVITIGTGTTTKVSGDARMEGGLTMAVAGTLNADRVVMGHNESGDSAGHFVADGGTIITNSVAAGDAANSSTLTLRNGGSLQITTDGEMFTGANTDRIAFTIENGKLVADTNNWTLNHDATIGTATVDAVGHSALTVSGVLSDMADTHGTLTKTGMGTLVLTGANTYTGTTTVDSGALVASNSEALSHSVLSFSDKTAEESPYRVFAFATDLRFNNSTGALEDAGTQIDGTIKGLDGHRGYVVANTLTIDVNEGETHTFNHRYDDNNQTSDRVEMKINRLVKTGAGTQIIGGDYSEARGFTTNGLVISHGVEVQQGTLFMMTRGIVTTDFNVAAGATLKTTDEKANSTTAAGAVQYNGKVTLHGTEGNAGTLFYNDGSTNTTNGLYVDGYANVVNQYDKHQFINGLYNAEGTTSNDISFTRPDSPWDGTDGYPAIIAVTAAGDFAGTIHLKSEVVKNNGTLVNENYGIQVLGTSAQSALANAAIDFTGDDVTVLSFRNSDTASATWTDSKMDGAVGGLQGTNGAVYANTLTVNTAEGGEYTYGGALHISGITKQGTGTQILQGTNVALGNVSMQGGTLNFSSGTATATTIYSNADSLFSVGSANGEGTAVVTATRIELGDMDNGSSNHASSNLKVFANGTLVVTGNTNNTDEGGYKSDSLVLGEWNADSAATISGNLLAEGADLLIGDTGNYHKVTFTIDGGTVAVKGVNVGALGKNANLEMNLTNGGKLILGEDGYYTRTVTGSPTFTTSVTRGTIGISADTVAFNKGMTITDATFDTKKYAFNTAGTAISQAEDATGGSLTVNGDITGESSSTLHKVGVGTLTLNGSNAAFTGNVDVQGGTLVVKNHLSGNTLNLSGDGTTVTFNHADDAESGTTFSGNIVANAAGGTLNVNGEAPLTANTISLTAGTTLNFDQKVTLSSNSRPEMLYTNNDQAATYINFDGGYAYSGNAGYALLAGKNVHITMDGTSNLGSKSIGFTGGASLTLKDGASLTAGRIYSGSKLDMNGTVNVGANATLTVSGSNDTTQITNLNLSSGSTTNFAQAATNIETLSVGSGSATLKHGSNTVTANATNIGGVLDVYYSSSTNGTVNLGALTMTSEAATIKNTNFGGEINIASLSGEGTLTLMAASDSTAHTKFNIGSSANTETQFSGTLVLDQANSTGRERTVTWLLKDDKTAANADVQMQHTAAGSNTVDAKLALGAETVAVKSLSDTGSGTAVFHIAKDSSVTAAGATLQITGNGEHTTAATVDGSVNIAMTGEGTQAFTGDMSAFDGNLTVQDGTLHVATDTMTQAKHVEVAADALLKLKAGASLSVNELVLGNVTAPAAEAGPSTRDIPAPVVMSDVPDGDVNANITVTGTQDDHGTLAVGIGGTDVRGINLSVSGTVDYSAVPGNILDLNGGSLTLSTLSQPSINLSDSLLTPLESHQMVEVMSGIGALTVNDFSLSADAISGMNAGELVVVGSASSVFGNNFGNQNAQVLFRADGGTGTLLVTPEPTTTALSLLALAALAARRKRK